MPISRKLFNLKGNLPDAAPQLASALADALVGVSLKDDSSPAWVRELELILAEYQRGDMSDAEFMERVRAILG